MCSSSVSVSFVCDCVVCICVCIVVCESVVCLCMLFLPVFTAGMLTNNLSDNLPCFIILDTLLSKQSAIKWITIRLNNQKTATIL